FLEQRDGRWGIVLRQPIYESDRIIPVDPTAPPQLDRALLESFPVGYRHLAYLQTRNGFTVKPDMPGLTGPEVEALYASCSKWLSGENLDRGPCSAIRTPRSSKPSARRSFPAPAASVRWPTSTPCSASCRRRSRTGWWRLSTRWILRGSPSGSAHPSSRSS